MRFMMIMYPGAKAEQGNLPDAEAIARMMAYNEELTKAGVLLGLDGLQASAKGFRVTWTDGKAVLTDGPFAEAKELVGGYWMIQVKSIEEAREWARRIPGDADARVEVRQVFEMSDFTVDAETQAQADRVSAALPRK